MKTRLKICQKRVFYVVYGYPAGGNGPAGAGYAANYRPKN